MEREKNLEPEIVVPVKKQGAQAQERDGQALTVYEDRPFFTQAWERAEQSGLLSEGFEERFQRDFGVLQNKYIKLRELDIFEPTAMLDARTTVRNLLNIGLYLSSEGDPARAAAILSKGDFNQIARVTLDEVKKLRQKAKELRERSILKISPSEKIAQNALERDATKAQLLWGNSFIDPIYKQIFLEEIFPDKKISLFDCINYISSAFDRGESHYDDGKDLNIVEKHFSTPEDLVLVAKALDVVETLLKLSETLDWKEVFNLSGLVFERPQETHPHGWLRTATITMLISAAQEKPSIVVTPSAIENFLQKACNEYGEIPNIDDLAIWFVEQVREKFDMNEAEEYVVFKWAMAHATILEQDACEMRETIMIEGSNAPLPQFYSRYFVTYSRDEFFEFNIKPLSNTKEVLLAELTWAKNKAERRKVLDTVEFDELDWEGVLDFLHDAGNLSAEYVNRLPLDNFSETELADLFESADLSEEVMNAMADEIYRRIDISGWEIANLKELYQYLSPENRRTLKTRAKIDIKTLVAAVGEEYETHYLEALYAMAQPEQLFDLLIEFCDTPSATGSKPAIDSPNKKALLAAVKMLSENELCDFFKRSEQEYRRMFKKPEQSFDAFLKSVQEKKSAAPQFVCKNLALLFNNLEKPLCIAVRDFFAQEAASVSLSKNAKTAQAQEKKAEPKSKPKKAAIKKPETKKVEPKKSSTKKPAPKKPVAKPVSKKKAANKAAPKSKSQKPSIKKATVKKPTVKKPPKKK